MNKLLLIFVFCCLFTPYTVAQKNSKPTAVFMLERQFSTEPTHQDLVKKSMEIGLRNHFNIMTTRELSNLVEQKLEKDEISQEQDPAAYIQMRRKLQDELVKFTITLSFSTKKAGGKWHASVATRCTDRQTAREVWKFQIRSGRLASAVEIEGTVTDEGAQKQALENVMQQIVKRVIAIVTLNSSLSRHITLLFTGFTQKQRETIKGILTKLNDTKQINVLSYFKRRGILQVVIKFDKNRWTTTKFVKAMKKLCRNKEIDMIGRATSNYLLEFNFRR